MVAEIASSYGAIWDEFSEQPAPKNIKKNSSIAHLALF